jgi:hypothetical protein
MQAIVIKPIRGYFNHILGREYIEFIFYIMATQSNLGEATKSRYNEK